MGFLNWVQKKFNKGKAKRFEPAFNLAQCNSSLDPYKEEIMDWPQGLLSIGMLGNEELKNDTQQDRPTKTSHSFQDIADFSLEEMIKLQKELTKHLKPKPKSSSAGLKKGGETANLPLNRFLDCPSSLEVDRTSNLRISSDLDDGEDGNLSPKTKIILNKARDLLANKRNPITQRSITFLLKKIFVCSHGFAPTPNFKDPLMESRMEKLLKTMLHKKIYPQNSAWTSTTKQLENKSIEETNAQDETQEKWGHKWVTTDSDFIVLEI